MTTRELLENASLAALGLLDADEHAVFERALSRAPQGVREHILREQARWAGGGELLPNVEAPGHLRERVLDAVRGAIVDDEIAHSAGAFDAPSFGGARRVSALWRGGALGLVCACVILSGMLFYVRQSNKESIERLSGIQVGEALGGTFGQRFVNDVVFDASTRRVAFQAERAGFDGRLAIYTNDKWSSWRAVYSDMPALPEGQEYQLVSLTADGRVDRKLAAFDSNVALSSAGVEPVEVGTQIALVVVPVGGRASADVILMRATFT
ncbi:MAG: hypothetical protein U0637_12230 [Phycisphaerales bacterium]